MRILELGLWFMYGFFIGYVGSFILYQVFLWLRKKW